MKSRRIALAPDLSFGYNTIIPMGWGQVNTDRLEAGTIRILNQHGATAGTGFIASRQLAVTCAHVVRSAGAKPGDILTVQFHLNNQRAQVEVLTEGWDQDDIALLSIKGNLPEGVQPVPMRSYRGSVGDEYHALGYPEDGPVEERRPLGEILGQVHVQGFEHPLVQVDGKFIDKGLSGAPAAVGNDQLIGMFTAYRDLERETGSESVRLAYLISTDTLWEIVPELRPSPTLFPSRYPLLEGIDQLPFGYASRIQNFLIEYLGTKERPEPFGGREESLAQLDRWLESGDRPYLLLTAPAGRGKSALLVHWLEQIQSRTDLAIVFIPASVRFNTNLSNVFFASLAARLAFLHGEPAPTRADTDWRGLAAAYLSRPLSDGRTLLVVMDALDEAGDWEAGRDLLPLDPLDGLRIVVSARSDQP